MKNALYNNAKLQGFLALGIPEHFCSYLLRIANKNSGYVFNQEHSTEMNITNICWIYSVFHHKPSNLMIMDVHLSQRLAYITCAL